VRRLALSLVVPLIAVAVLAGCGEAHSGTVSDGTNATSSADAVITVTSTDDACEVSTATSAPGNLAFVVTNGGSDSTSFEVLAFTGGQVTVGLASDIPVGETRTLLVPNVVPGEYITVCEPGAGGQINANFEVEDAASELEGESA
jgi:iron uptake system component EfeO